MNRSLDNAWRASAASLRQSKARGANTRVGCYRRGSAHAKVDHSSVSDGLRKATPGPRHQSTICSLHRRRAGISVSISKCPV
ncbi:hypothetical protein, partial [Burkholderia sp. ABCPW 14]|uniref:hypothetical protein n=1 Tax=Burkholderia sp. ABCPW 14 TaxID=1637860 RepID=UPI001E284E2B